MYTFLHYQVAFSRRVIRLFTKTSITVLVLLAAVRGNQNLRTVIVTADIDGGLYHPAPKHR